MDLGAVERRMVELYTAMGPRSWPDPHADRDPVQQEYSRVTDPDRLMIVQQRTTAWMMACVELLEAEVAPPLDEHPLPVVEPVTFTMTSPRPGCLPITARLETGEHPEVTLGRGPDDADILRCPGQGCGCDACDSGSESELWLIDDFFGAVLTGSLVRLHSESWSAHLDTRDGSAGAGGAVPEPMTFDAACQVMWRIGHGQPVELPSRVAGSHGATWLDQPAGPGGLP